MQVPEAQGRYICSHSSIISTKTLSDILQKRFPQYKFPAGDDQPSKEVIDNSKVRPSIPKGRRHKPLYLFPPQTRRQFQRQFCQAPETPFSLML